MNSIDPEYRRIVDSLRSGGHYSGKPPLPPETESDKNEPVRADWEPRVSRLEMGVLACVALVFTAIISSYLMLASRIEVNGDQISAGTVATSDLRGDVKVINERTVNMDKKLDAISARLDRK